MVFDIVVSLWILRLVFRSMGTRLNQAHKVAFAFGLISPIIIFGIAASASFPLVIMDDLDIHPALFAHARASKVGQRWKLNTLALLDPASRTHRVGSRHGDVPAIVFEDLLTEERNA